MKKDKKKKLNGDKAHVKGCIYAPNADATKCMQMIDKAYFSFECMSDFDYFLNALETKIKIYRKMRGA